MRTTKAHFLASLRPRFINLLFEFIKFLFYYAKKKILGFSVAFEKQKNKLVKFFLMKRGRYNRPFLHLTTMGVLVVGIFLAPYLADTYPVFSSKASALDLATASTKQQSILIGEDVFQTAISQKPRDKVLVYTVEKGDTITTIAKKFQISEDTIRWENDLSSDDLSIGDTLRILPVTGIAHKVSEGDTVYTIAKRYDTEAQKIVDFPFNEFANPETFSLIAGQILIVPDGVKPSEQHNYVRPDVYIAQGPTAPYASGFTWPLHGGISQFASWYHMALDITSPYDTPIVAAQSGKVVRVSLGTWDTGYGNNVYVDNGAGYKTHYAHMDHVYVSAGDTVVAGKSTIGSVGLTGRTTGPHLHFEILQNGTLVNPMLFLQ